MPSPTGSPPSVTTDRNPAGRGFRGENRRRQCRDDQIRIQGDEFTRETRKALELSFAPSEVERDIASFDITEVAQTGTDRFDFAHVARGRSGAEKADAPDFRGLLRE